MARALDRIDEALNPPRNHQGKPGEDGKPGEGQSGEEAAEQARQEFEQAAQEIAKDMQEARDAGLRAGQLPPPGEGDGSGAGFKNPPKPVNLPDFKTIEELVKRWNDLKPKDRQQALDRLRAQGPEFYRPHTKAFRTAVGTLQGGQPALKPK